MAAVGEYFNYYVGYCNGLPRFHIVVSYGLLLHLTNRQLRQRHDNSEFWPSTIGWGDDITRLTSTALFNNSHHSSGNATPTGSQQSLIYLGSQWLLAAIPRPLWFCFVLYHYLLCWHCWTVTSIETYLLRWTCWHIIYCLYYEPVSSAHNITACVMCRGCNLRIARRGP